MAERVAAHVPAVGTALQRDRRKKLPATREQALADHAEERRRRRSNRLPSAAAPPASSRRENTILAFGGTAAAMGRRMNRETTRLLACSILLALPACTAIEESEPELDTACPTPGNTLPATLSETGFFCAAKKRAFSPAA